MLTTKRLILRTARAGDLDDLFAIYSDPRAMRYWSTPPHETRDQTRDNLNRMMASADATPTYFVMEHQSHVIGCAGMHSGDEVGFILHPDHWRQGFVTEAMRAIIPYLFQSTNVDRLTADVDPRNLASVKCLNSLGFTQTGTAKNTYCVAGEWSDSVYFAIPRP